MHTCGWRRRRRLGVWLALGRRSRRGRFPTARLLVWVHRRLCIWVLGVKGEVHLVVGNVVGLQVLKDYGLAQQLLAQHVEHLARSTTYAH